MKDASSKLPQRRGLAHTPPSWVPDAAIWFITICGLKKGVNQFCEAEVFERLCESIEVRVALRQWWPYLVLFMPDHMHGLGAFPREPGMRKVVSDWKHFTARHLGVTWERDFFDHRLRSNESYDEKAAYIRNNPVRAELVKRAEDWPYVWENPHPGLNTSL